MAKGKELTDIVSSVNERVRATNKAAIKVDAELKRLVSSRGVEASKAAALRKAVDALLVAA